MLKRKQIEYIRVFLASPGDVCPERNSVKAILQDINETFLLDKGLALELVTYEEDTFPDYGDHAQYLIDKQISEDNEIIIVIFWSTLGYKIPNNLTGTLHEFNEAIKSYNKRGYPRIMLYFKTERLHPLKLDLKKLEGVQKLYNAASNVKSKIFYKTFESTDDFKTLLKKNLVNLLRDMEKKNALKTKSNYGKAVVSKTKPIV